MPRIDPLVKPIVVLGGSGFIGTRLVARFKELGHETRIGDLKPSDRFSDLYTQCDVRNARTIQGILLGAGSIINLAAEHRDDVRPISRYYETNVEGARQVCLAATEAGIKTLVFTSSAAVYRLPALPCGRNWSLRALQSLRTDKARSRRNLSRMGR